MSTKKSLFRSGNPEKPVLSVPLRGRVTGVAVRSAISWGDPGRNDDWIIPVFMIEVDLSAGNSAATRNRMEIGLRN